MSHDITPYTTWEHGEIKLARKSFPGVSLNAKYFGKDKSRICFQILNADDDNYALKADYYIGVDWLVENHSSIIIAPKLNTRIEVITEECKEDNDIEIDEEFKKQSGKGKEVTIDYFAMLNQCLAVDFLYKEIDNLVHIDWKANEIPIQQEADMLSPLLIVKFLNVLYSIVRKGVKKSYFQTRQNLNSKIKGKILIAENIKQNVLKNRLAKTFCQFEEFGIDTLENRLLKKAFIFAVSYLDNHRKIFNHSFSDAEHLINYCRPAFEMVSEDANINDLKSYKPNPFFKEYGEGIHLAKLILKRYSYSLSNINKEKITTPPYWIDMPKLFELYAYYFLKQKFPNNKDVDYHFRTYGNELDFLVNTGNTKMVVDAKYKPLYIYGKDHKDMRQVSGYARLEKTFKELGMEKNELIDCLIVYPDVENGTCMEVFKKIGLMHEDAKIKGYCGIYKVGIKLPEKKSK
jgi:5-methylcytosine-specific restriction endonuclease McrBC regulatory subunit McrC